MSGADAMGCYGKVMKPEIPGMDSLVTGGMRLLFSFTIYSPSGVKLLSFLISVCVCMYIYYTYVLCVFICMCIWNMVILT